MSRRLRNFLIVATGLLLAAPAFAHEAYVLPRDFFWSVLQGPISWHAIDAWRDLNNVHVTVMVICGTFALLGANFLFRRSAVGRRLHRGLERLAFVGPHLVRATIAIALFTGAVTGSFLGPELPIAAMPFPVAVRLSLIAASVLVALGAFTEVAAAIGLTLFTLGLVTFGSYLLTYLNYFGELLVLLLFGMRAFSVDKKMFGPLRRFPGFRKYETSIVRVCYGFALVYAAITVKFLHPELTVRVVNDWHLTTFTWLFPHDPLLVTLGAGLAETAIGLFIIFGFELRMTVLISLFYITLSLLYFREQVWPHLLLYGISLNLLFEPETFTIDHLLFGEPRAPGAKKARD